MIDEFSGIDQTLDPAPEEAGFAAGVVRGVRAFDVDKFGRLLGVTFRQVWTPGENRAECKRRYDGDIAQAMHAMTRAFFASPVAYYSVPAVPAPSSKPAMADEPHAMRDCKHGFYAYYDGSNDYKSPGRINAVVEGYGETVIGTRGFRCMKARIVALHFPKHIPEHLRRMVARNYPDVAVLESFKRMVAEFPPDPAGNEISPDSDPDFWTRPA